MAEPLLIFGRSAQDVGGRDKAYEALETVLHRKATIIALQARCGFVQHGAASNQQQSSASRGPQQQAASHGCQGQPSRDVRKPSDCTQQPDNNSITHPPELSQQDKLAAELLHIRSWRQQRQDAANAIASAVKDWLQRLKAQQQVLRSHLQWLKARRVLTAWREQAAQRRQVHGELADMQADFSRAVTDAWHAETYGFAASSICQEEGVYGVAAAYCKWRLKGMVFLAWAHQVLGWHPAGRAGVTVLPGEHR
jgi:hypothetical protein